MKDLYGKAAAAAQSWGNDAEKEAVATRKAALSTSAGAWSPEHWAINKAVHYNEWANFGKKDFEPVVGAFKALLSCFRCETCESWVHVTPRGIPGIPALRLQRHQFQSQAEAEVGEGACRAAVQRFPVTSRPVTME